MLHCSFSLAAEQLLVKTASALQKSKCCSATSAAQHSEICSATSVFACGMLQGWGLEGWGLGLPDKLLSPVFFRWSRGLPQEGVGAKKFGISLETREFKLFGRDVPGFCPGYPGGARKVWGKKCVQFSSPTKAAPTRCDTQRAVPH